MTPAKGDASMLEKLFLAGGATRLVVAAGASALVVSSGDENGVQRERFRLVAIPDHRYKVEFADGGRWKNGGVTGPLEKVVAELFRAHATRLT